MSSVRASKYRHVYGAPHKREKCFDNIRLTKNAFDSNLAKANGKFVSLCWNASGGGAFAVLPVEATGKLSERFPLFVGHKGAVLDTDWNPFNDRQVVSASDDGTIGVWEVPENFSVKVEEGQDLDLVRDVEPQYFLSGHEKRVGHVLFNPVAENVLASSSLDYTIKVWDISAKKCLYTLKHPDAIMSFAWNHNGTKIASTCKDKKVRVWDVRAEKVLSIGEGHSGSKSSRIVWLGNNNRVLTTGFSRLSDRQIALWDTEDLAKGPIKGFKTLDQSSGVIMPFYDEGTSMLYLGGRGDGTITYFEFANDELHDLFAYHSTEPQRGLAFAPDNSLNVHAHEVSKCYKVHESHIEPIPFLVPRKVEGFLSDIYHNVKAPVPSLTAAMYVSGKTVEPLQQSWRDIYDGVEPKTTTAPAPEAEPMAEPKAEPKTEPKVEAEEDPKPAVKEPEAKPEAKEVKVETKVEVEDTKVETKIETRVEPEPEVKKFSSDILSSVNAEAFASKFEVDDSAESSHEGPSSWDEPEPKVEKSKEAPTAEAAPVKSEPAGAEPEAEAKKAEAEPEAEPKDKAEPEVTSKPSELAENTPKTATPAKTLISKITALNDRVSELTAVVAALAARVEQLEGGK